MSRSPGRYLCILPASLTASIITLFSCCTYDFVCCCFRCVSYGVQLPHICIYYDAQIRHMSRFCAAAVHTSQRCLHLCNHSTYSCFFVRSGTCSYVLRRRHIFTFVFTMPRLTYAAPLWQCMSCSSGLYSLFVPPRHTLTFFFFLQLWFIFRFRALSSHIHMLGTPAPIHIVCSSCKYLCVVQRTPGTYSYYVQFQPE
jgi:hypothetical protein